MKNSALFTNLTFFCFFGGSQWGPTVFGKQLQNIIICVLQKKKVTGLE